MFVDSCYLIDATPVTPVTVDCWRLGIYVGPFTYRDPLIPESLGTLTTRNVSYVTISI